MVAYGFQSILQSVKDGERTGEMSYEQVAAVRGVEDLTMEERHACDRFPPR